jgi:uncharacterized protein (TIGR02453 family)
MPFTGFPPATTRFLAGLSRHNTREWFEDNRERYERDWLEPAKAFVEAAGEALVDLEPGIVAEPRVNGSIFRINRDIRFSSDKRPYKDHLDFWFWEGERRDALSGFFLRLTARKMTIGVGAHQFHRGQLETYRARVADPRDGAHLMDAVRALSRAGIQVSGEHYKRAPRGYELEGERERLIRFNALYAAVEQPHPRSLRTGRFVDYCMTRWRRMAPLHRWLVDEPA